MQKRIIYITVRSDIGGGQKHIFQILSNIDKNKFIIYIACPEEGCYFEKYKQMTSGWVEIPFRMFSVLSLFKLCRFINNNKISLIHSHGKGGGIYGRLAGLLTGTNVVHTYHGLHFTQYNSFFRFLYFHLEKFLSGLSKRIIHVSFSEETLALEHALHQRNNSEVIYNGVDLNYYIFSPQGRKAVRQQLKISDSEFTIGTIARFDYPKGIEISLEIISKLREEIPVKYILVGDGPQKADIKKFIAERGLANNVIEMGLRNDIPNLMSAFDVYLSTSRYEGLPYALIEAMAVGLPIVASDVIGNNEVIENNKTGFLIPLMDKQGFVKIITKLYKDADLRKQSRAHARKRVEECFDVSDMVKKVEDIYNGII